MSLARFRFPSITHVLEAEGLIPKEAAAPAEEEEEEEEEEESGQPDASAGLAVVVSPSSVQSHLMKTVDYRDYNYDADDEESTTDDDEDAPGDVDAVGQAKEDDTAELNLENIKQDHALSIWVKNNLPRVVEAVRRLFPMKVAEILVRKIMRKLAAAL